MIWAGFAAERGVDGPIFIEPAQGFEVYLAAGMTKKQVPAHFTADKAARYVLRSTSDAQLESTGGKLVRCVFLYCVGLNGTSTAGVTLVDTTTQEILWSYEVQKRGAHNYQSRAEAVAKHLKHFLEGKEGK
jgi:hypothetical protein